MFFSRPGEYEPCQMYTTGHFILLAITFGLVIILLQYTRKSSKEQVKKIIRNTTIILWILEIIKIIFNFAVGHASNPNHYIPLYYCSIILYAGLFSSFGEGTAKKVGDIFIATGAIIGGTFFLSTPNTSLTMYPMFHYISIQSFIFHGAMVYLGILVNITKYVDLKLFDIRYYAVIITVMVSISYAVNATIGTNFMFISQNFPNTPIDAIYNGTGEYFTLVMSLMQIILPFLIIYTIKLTFDLLKIATRKLRSKSNIEEVKYIENSNAERTQIQSVSEEVDEKEKIKI